MNVTAQVKNGILEVRTDDLVLKYSVDSTASVFIGPVSRRNRLDGTDVTFATGKWFSLLLDGKRIDNRGRHWQFVDLRVTTLSDKATEIEAAIAHAGDVAFELTFVLRVSDGSPVTRERIEIRRKSGRMRLACAGNGKPAVTFGGHIIEAADVAAAEEVRIATWDGAPRSCYLYHDHSRSYQYYPERRAFTPGRKRSFKGPVFIGVDRQRKLGLLYAYEHGSADGQKGNDFFHVECAQRSAGVCLATRSRDRGVYLDGQVIDRKHPFRTAWVDFAVFKAAKVEAGEAVLWHFLRDGINPRREPATPYIYYNTWGMQINRSRKGEIYADSLHEKSVLEEIPRAAELGCDIFVIDFVFDNAMQGGWELGGEKFPRGVAPIKRACEKNDMRLGMWMAPQSLCTASSVWETYKHCRQRDGNGRCRSVEMAAFGTTQSVAALHQMCLSSEWTDHLIETMKQRIDEGIDFFKWDGLQPCDCRSSRHRHGGSAHSAEDRAAAANCNHIVELTRMAEELCRYHPDTIVEYDVSEPRRSVGLGFLSAGKYFWQNSGAACQGDFTARRIEEMRKIVYRWGRLVPTTLMNAANHPHNDGNAQKAAVHTTILGLGGFWGDLARMSEWERKRAGAIVNMWKKVRDTTSRLIPEITGELSGLEEYYTCLDRDNSHGMIIGYSNDTAAVKDRMVRGLNPARFKLLLNQPYTLHADGRLLVHFDYDPSLSASAFVIGGEAAEFKLLESTLPIVDFAEQPGAVRLDWAAETVWGGPAPDEKKHRLRFELARRAKVAVTGDIDSFRQRGTELIVSTTRSCGSMEIGKHS